MEIKHTADSITKFLLKEYNVGLIALTALLWAFSYYFGYWNKNFDMFSTLEGYIVAFSLVSIVVGVLGQEKWQKLIKLGVITKVVAVFALVTSKSIVVSPLGVWVLSPVSIFCFFVLVKNIWIESGRKLHKGTGSK